MNPCPDCGRSVGHASVDLVVGMHGHEVDGLVTCERHGSAQRVVAVTGPGDSPVVVCRACWTDVYAHASAFLLAAMPALRDHNAQQQPAPRPVADLGAMMANVMRGACWCGAPFVAGSIEPERKGCSAGHWVQVHRFDGGRQP